MTSKAAAASALARSGLAPRGLSREQASAYVGLSATAFDGLVEAGVMPAPKLVGHRRVWDRHALDTAFTRLPNADGTPSDDADDTWAMSA